MRRVSRADLRTNISIGLMVLAPYRKKAFGLHIEKIREDIVDELVQRIMGRPESEAVIVEPSMVGPVHGSRRGVWGEDEPHPHPDLQVREY